MVENGDQTNPVDQTENIDDKTPGEIETPSNETPENQVPQDEITGNTTGTYDETDESTSIPDAGNQDQVEDSQVTDETVGGEQQAADQEAQDTANENEIVGGMTDEEFENWANSL